MPTTRLLLCLSVLLGLLVGHVELWAQPTKGLHTDGQVPPGNEQRLALLIGNAAYDTAPLRNPVNDARAMGTTLRGLGFRVQVLENAPLTKMKQAIDEFGDTLQRDRGVGLFYFSGHGMQVKGRNFIIPIGAQIKGERDIEYESVDVGRVLGKMEDAGNRMNMVILDACRDNPFARSFRSATGGLASLDAASGTFIAYATAPGRTADDGVGTNGLYTAQLIRYLQAPGLKVEDVFKRVRVEVEQQSNGKQVPWEASSLKGDFYFAGQAAPTVAVVPQTPVTPPAPPLGNPPRASEPARTINEEEALWKVIENSENPVDFTEYLRAYPNGRFVPAAQAKLRRLQRAAAPPAPRSPQPHTPSAPPAETAITPSFNCQKASLPTEKLICADAALATLDVQMARLYAATLQRVGDKDALRQSQRAWLKARRDACADITCVRQAYQERIAELSR